MKEILFNPYVRNISSMTIKFIWKIKLFYKAILILKNWIVYPVVYFQLTNKIFIFFITRDNTKIKIRTGKKSTDIHVFTEIWLENVYLKKINVKSDWTVIDVGAHIGLFSLFVSRLCDKGKVYCFEPDEENYKLLLENINNNRKNILAENSIISSKSGFKQFYVSDSDFAAGSIHKKSNQSALVKSNTISDVLVKNKIQNCNLLKLDCEGAEYDIIMSLSFEDLNKIDNICMEYEKIDSQEYTIQDIISKLKSNNFSVEIISTTPLMGFLFAKKY
jgi:FkbM family methyltransferase